MLNWRGLIKRLDDAVDETWSERVRLVPMTADSQYSISTVDAARTIVETSAVYCVDDTTVRMRAGSNTEAVGSKIYLSIQREHLDAIGGKGLVAQDAVVMLERNNAVFNIAYIDPDEDTFRPRVYLLRSNVEGTLLMARKPGKIFEAPHGSLPSINMRTLRGKK